MAVRIVSWGEGDQPLLQRLLGDPVMMEHLGGPESAEKIAERHARYVRTPAGVYKVLDAASGEPAGWVGFWERSWRDEIVCELGWSVLPGLQGQGIAGEATALALDAARAEGAYHHAHAFPSVDNAPSNAICEKLGFELLGPFDLEYPPGHTMRCNDWRLAL